ncbi:hypothetical protein ACFLYW_02470, partial [Thermodesulfobacteriota bacterium]
SACILAISSQTLMPIAFSRASNTIVQVLSRYNLLLPVLFLHEYWTKRPFWVLIFYEEKVVFAPTLWYIAFFGPSRNGRLRLTLN